MFKSAYLKRVYATCERRNPQEKEFLQAVKAVFTSLDYLVDKKPEWEANALIERFVEPERVLEFRVPWLDDRGKVQVNRGYRVQFNSAVGPYKGGCRFHPSVNLSIMKFLALEQTLKNSLTSLPLGGGKGGADFDPKGKSDREIMRFCQSYMNELYRHIGQFTDIPSGDIGCGKREIGYMYGQYKRIVNRFESAVLTGKGLSYGGSLGRTQATGYGLCYFAAELLAKLAHDSFKGKKVIISGSGNVAQYAALKCTEMGAEVIAMSDSDGYITDQNGIKLSVLIPLKQQERARIAAYVERVNGAQYHEDPKGLWDVKCDIAMPCACQNEVDAAAAMKLVKNGAMALFEGANMPLTAQAQAIIRSNGLLYAPAKAANAGGVAVSGLEMVQNSIRTAWRYEEVDAKLQAIMKKIFMDCYETSAACGKQGDILLGANIAGFLKVAEAMMEQGIV